MKTRSYCIRIHKSLITLSVLGLLSACQSNNSPQFIASSDAFPLGVAPFDNYQKEIEKWIDNNRIFITDNQYAEREMNMPFECQSQNSDKGVFLVHGLGDSPYFLKDIADALCENGIRVRTILLPGHGTKPGDMLNVTFEQWYNETAFQLHQFMQEVDKVYAGGFSTGANLTTLLAINNDDIDGLMLFSPAFKSRFFVSKLAPHIDGLLPWPNVEQEDNPTRYNSTAMQGFGAYQESVNALQKAFTTQHITAPVMMVIAAQDSVVDTQSVAEQFRDDFLASKKCLIWQGAPPAFLQKSDAAEQPSSHSEPVGYGKHILIQPMGLPERRVGAASHMSPLFSPDNPFYGEQSSFRICDNGQSAEKEARCKSGETVWFGPWGMEEDDKIYARLTYNPYFDKLVDQMLAFTDTAKMKAFCKVY